jgi:2-polyprenyl-3-methyl-5-hydroxy-6-metoxy-1,4-benzoquinol methylase
MFKYLNSVHDGVAHKDKYANSNLIAKYLLNNFLEVIYTTVYGLNPKSIFEVGCGEGHLLKLLYNTNIDIIGIDVNDPSILIAKNIFKGVNNVKILNKSIYNLNQDDFGADVVLCCEVLEHLTDPEAAIIRLKSITSRYCILSVPNEPIWHILNMVRGKYLTSLGNTPGYYNHWSKNQFIKFASKYFHISLVKTSLPWTILLCESKK